MAAFSKTNLALEAGTGGAVNTSTSASKINSSASRNLVSSPTLILTPYILVLIGKYKFGAYNKDEFGSRKYPNYIQSLSVEKINGLVNTYTLGINYVITENDDPNYFEKIFSSVSESREIVFTYGDLAAKNYVYREEKAIITQIDSSFSIEGSNINYTVTAVSKGSLTMSGVYPFTAPNKKVKPSSEILRILKDNTTYGLQNLFVGMKDMAKVDALNLIPTNDQAVLLESSAQQSVLDRLQYLVSCMVPEATKNTAVSNKGSKAFLKYNLALDANDSTDTYTKTSGFYIMQFLDDTSDVLGGPYFKIVQVDSAIEHPEAYELNIGYPNGNAVTSFHTENNENYSIYYNYQNELHPESYVRRLNKYGEYEDFYAPTLSSNNNTFTTRENDKIWWTKASQYPIKASISVKGLLRPAVLMSYVRLHIYFFGRKHIHSGLYIITKLLDKIDEQGYSTTLDMQRVGEDDTNGIS